MAADVIYSNTSGTIPAQGVSNLVTVTFSDPVWNYFLANISQGLNGLCAFGSITSYSNTLPHGNDEPAIEYQDASGGWHSWEDFIDILSGVRMFGVTMSDWRQTMSFRLFEIGVNPCVFTGLTVTVEDTCGGFGTTSTMIAGLGIGASANVLASGSGSAHAGLGLGTGTTPRSIGRAYSQIIG